MKTVLFTSVLVSTLLSCPRLAWFFFFSWRSTYDRFDLPFRSLLGKQKVGLSYQTGKLVHQPEIWYVAVGTVFGARVCSTIYHSTETMSLFLRSPI